MRLKTRYKISLFVSSPSGKPLVGEDARVLQKVLNANIQTAWLEGLDVSAYISRESLAEKVGNTGLDLWGWLKARRGTQGETGT